MNSNVVVAIVTGSLVFISAITTQVVQNWFQRRREGSAKALELRSKAYSNLVARMQVFAHLFIYFDRIEGKDIRLKSLEQIKSENQLYQEGKWTGVTAFGPRLSIETLGNLWTELEQSIGECMLFAGEKLRSRLTEVEDQIYSLEILSGLKEITDAKGSAFGPDFREQGVLFREMRTMLLNTMREELGATFRK